MYSLASTAAENCGKEIGGVFDSLRAAEIASARGSTASPCNAKKWQLEPPTSRCAGMSEHTMRQPARRPSAMGSPNPSVLEGETSASQLWKHHCNSCSETP